LPGDDGFAYPGDFSACARPWFRYLSHDKPPFMRG
jgi:hypothetical protein